MKVEFLHQANGASKELPLLKEVGQLKDYTQSDFPQYPPIQPRTMFDNLDDREMAAANPQIRSFLQTAFMMSCSHAYEVWQYMVSKGYYPLEAAQPDTIAKVGGMYQVIPEDQPQIQQYLNQYQNPIVP
ncbi:MAG: hypothetical protein CVU91_05875 [Firmicutes bacterium HGW-Firmicutes-16]|nr:MAG: hypothetical protein CVU91_05875 [Firmicutes bacterium HGW-Firmicutes-16]